MNVWGSGGAHAEYFKIIDQIIIELFNRPIADQPIGILDMGCGTGVLAILAELKGASKIDAIDIDSWCYLNSLENIKRNNCKNITIYEGDATLLKGNKYDIIIANINRNILLEDLKQYASCLSKDGILFLSGFYENDIKIIETECNKYMLKLVETLERNNWVSLKLLN